MRHLPLFAQLRGRPCLVVGGGAVAERRVELLRAAGAEVTVLAPELTAGLARLAAQGALGWERGRFEAPALAAYWLVIAATDDAPLNARVCEAAEAACRFCNVVDDPERCSFIMPAIVDRDPVTIAIASGGRAPVLSRWVKGLIEVALPLRLGALADLMGRWRPQVRAALGGLDQRRRFWEHVLQSRVAQDCLSGRERDAEAALAAALAAWQTGAAAGAGEAYLVGAGPGSPDLITLRGRQLLAQAEVVLYDRLISPKLLEFARRDAELISVGKTPGRPSITQKQLNRLLVRRVSGGKRVCRLKGGDPMVFGRGGEELEALAAAGLPFQVVPGVSAVEGCAAYAGIPLTLRGVAQAVLLATGHGQHGGAPDLAAFAPGQTLALYMGVARYAEISEQLLALGHDPQTPVAVVESGTTEAQRVIRTVLRALPRAAAALEIRPPALLLVGETTRFAERYSWFAPERLELFEARDEPTQPAALARVI